MMAKMKNVFNGNFKWMMGIIIVIIGAAITYGRQCQKIDLLITEIDKKADERLVEERFKRIDDKLDLILKQIDKGQKDE